MIYIKSDTNSVQIPRHSNTNLTECRLEVINNLTQQSYDIDINDVLEYTFTYQLEIDPIELMDGEYTYKLFNDEVLVEKGLLVYGDYKREIQSYQKENKKIQYKG